MRFGGALLLIAVGAILRYATNFDIKGVDVDTVGLILMIVGIAMFVIALLYELLYAGERSRYYRYWGRDRSGYDAPPPGPDEPTRRV